MQSFRVGEGPIRAAYPECVRPDNDRNGFTMARDGHFLASEHAVEDLGQGRPCLADRHRGHIQDCTELHILDDSRVPTAETVVGDDAVEDRVSIRPFLRRKRLLSADDRGWSGVPPSTVG